MVFHLRRNNQKKTNLKKLIIVRGIPGSGKTTFAEFLFDNLEIDVDAACLAADDYFYDDEGVYHFDANKLHMAHLHCQQTVENNMVMHGTREQVQSVIIVHNTSTTPKELKPYLELAKKYGYEVTSLIVENRHGNENVHSVPEEVLTKMKNRFEVKL